MRILTVVEKLGPGGTERAAQNYTLGYQRAGHGVAVLSYAEGGPRRAELEAADVPVFVGGAGTYESEAIARAVAWSPDLIHIHRTGYVNPHSGQVLRALKAGAAGAPVLETNVFARVDYSPDRALIDVHLVLSRWCLWKWRRWAAGTQPKPIGAVVPYAVDPDRFYPVSKSRRERFREEHNIPAEAFLFGRIGQPSRWKWHPVLLDAFARVAARRPEAYLLVVGLPDSLRPALQAFPTDVRRRVVDIDFLHGDEALRACYGSLDAFVHAAQIGESFGMVLAEAMLCECPVITLSTPSKDNSQLEVVRHEVGGLVVTDQASMVQAMERLLGDPEYGKQLGRLGARRMRERFALEHIMPILLRIVEHVRDAPTREVLRQRLADDPDIVTRVQDAEVGALLEQALGTTSVLERIKMKLVHHPLLYRLWTTWKHRPAT